ncbi:uracil-DNA glycosylase family protein [Sphingomonas sp.]|uniref:uracil-DNA glycosylase family protein n=1 Tax=Sphingomonas sp. TaxID=28214 RepID=UPI0025D8DFBC|nr:uracil-DNA glycosylase family protein [Sphingomonas sp.]
MPTPITDLSLSSDETLDRLLRDIRACTRCTDALSHGPRPVVQAGRTARLCIIGHAPGRKVHETGIPWNDPSGVRLRDWLGITAGEFYDPAKVAIMPMGFCYPGKAPSGDNPPRPECAPLWHDRLFAELPRVGLTLLIGHHAQGRYLGGRRKATMGDTIRSWRDYLPQGYLPLPHPSPRNRPWLTKNPWFETELVPEVRAAVRSLGL